MLYCTVTAMGTAKKYFPKARGKLYAGVIFALELVLVFGKKCHVMHIVQDDFNHARHVSNLSGPQACKKSTLNSSARAFEPLRARVPNSHILSQNMYYDDYQFWGLTHSL